jgi:O-antigen/teichoic acid export membrane protein
MPPPTEPSQPIHLPLQRRNTTFKGDLLRLVTGTSLVGVITVLAAPILTRLYTPEMFGMAALFASLTGTLGIVACMRYELSIVLPDNDREAANLLGVSLCFSVLIALLTIFIVWLCGLQVLRWVRMPELAPYLWLVPITVLISGIFIALNYWNTRTKHFTRLSIAQVTSTLGNTSIVLGAGCAGYATGGVMIAANVGGQAIATTVLGGQIWWDNGQFLVQSITWREMWAGLKRHRKFPLFSIWGALLNAASWQLPVLMLGAFFSPTVVGFYALGFRIIQIPMGLIGGAISQVFLQRASVAKTSGQLALLVEGLFQKLLTISLLPSLILMVVGEDLFILVFGQNWSEAGIYAQLLALWGLIWFISSPLSTVYIVLEQQKKEPIIHTLIFTSRLLAIGTGGFLNSPRLAVGLFAISGLISYGYLIINIFSFSGLSLVNFLRANLKSTAITLVFIMPLIFLKLHSKISQINLLLTAGVTLVVYIFFYRRTFIN